MAMNKKGQIFTLISIFLIVLIFVSFEVYSTIRDKNVIKERVYSMQSFLDAIEDNLDRQMYIVGFRILFLAENEISSRGNYIDVNNFFNEAFYNGTIYGTNSTIMIGATYLDLINSINNKANKINVNITLKNTTLNVSQVDPWHIKVAMISDFEMNDFENLASWRKKQEVYSLIPIVGLQDPLFLVETYSKVAREINITPYEENYVSGSDVTNLSIHLANGYYAENKNAPSFLQRLEGNLSESEFGIESFVDISELTKQGLPTIEKSCTDFIYFSDDNPLKYEVSGMPSWFRIDDEDNRKEKYGLI